MQLFVRTLPGKIITVDVDGTDTLLAMVKQQIAVRTELFGVSSLATSVGSLAPAALVEQGRSAVRAATARFCWQTGGG